MLRDLIKMNSDYLGLQKIVGNILDCPGRGGNISVKRSGNILVKASGSDLKVPHKASFIETYSDVFQKRTYTIENEKNSIKITDNFIKPTMEHGLHTAIPAKYVVHYHPIYVLPYLCSDGLLDYCNYVLLDYCNPGSELAEHITKKFNDNELDKDSGIIMLKNHGVVIYANDIYIIKDLYNKIKDEFFQENLKSYTPDDIVDYTNPELYLYRMAMERISNIFYIKLNELSDDTKKHLLNDSNEKYRQDQMKGQI